MKRRAILEFKIYSCGAIIYHYFFKDEDSLQHQNLQRTKDEALYCASDATFNGVGCLYIKNILGDIRECHIQATTMCPYNKNTKNKHKLQRLTKQVHHVVDLLNKNI